VPGHSKKKKQSSADPKPSVLEGGWLRGFPILFFMSLTCLIYAVVVFHGFFCTKKWIEMGPSANLPLLFPKSNGHQTYSITICAMLRLFAEMTLLNGF
jgi:hypothetical protein